MFLLFLAELFLLFILSRFLTRELSLFFYMISRSKTFTSYFIALIFLPGTLVHELSHALVAKLLFVHVGKIELLPELQEESLKLGSVEVGKTDFIRNFFIGVAPFFVGTTLILFIMFYALSDNVIGLNMLTVFLVYVLFVISNSMYSSKKDLEGAVEFFVFVGLVIGLLYFFGVRPSSFGFLGELISTSIIQQAIYLLLLPVGIDVVIILLTKLVRKQ